MVSLEAHSLVTGHDATCFRVSDIPREWDNESLSRHLQEIDPELDLSTAEISGPFPDCNNPTKYQVALLNVNRPTSYLGGLKKDERRMECIRDTGVNKRFRIFIDRDFYDLTPLNTPETIAIDIIAVTGLAGHAFESWRGGTKSTLANDRPMWLRDFLPSAISNARIMTYGYNSSWRDPDVAHLLDHQRTFIQCLENARRDCRDRPIVFIGHGLGGILVVQTLIEVLRNDRHHSFGERIQGIILFGTPHNGARTDDLLEMVDHSNTDSKYFLLQLKEGSQFLEKEKDALVNLWRRYQGKTVTFFETRDTKQLTKTTEGEFAREGEAVRMVSRLSALLYLPGEYRYPVESDHINMVKFDSPNDRAFQTVITHLNECISLTGKEETHASLTQDAVKRYVAPQALTTDTATGSIAHGNKEIFFWPIKASDLK